MTPLQTTLPLARPRAPIELASTHATATPAPAIRSVRVSWFSHGGKIDGAGDRRFVLDVELSSDDTSALVQAWIERDGKRFAMLEPRLMRAARAVHDGIRHVDILGDNGSGRIAALSLLDSASGRNDAMLLYAQTPLLAEAGFEAGTYAPPTMVF